MIFDALSRFPAMQLVFPEHMPEVAPSLPLLRLGRNTASGTYEFFQNAAFRGGRYRADVVQFPGAGAIVAAAVEAVRIVAS